MHTNTSSPSRLSIRSTIYRIVVKRFSFSRPRTALSYSASSSTSDPVLAADPQTFGRSIAFYTASDPEKCEFSSAIGWTRSKIRDPYWTTPEK